MVIFRLWTIVARSRTMARMMELRFKLASIKQKPRRRAYGFRKARLKAQNMDWRFRTSPSKAQACGIPRFMGCTRALTVEEITVAITISPSLAKLSCAMINHAILPSAVAQGQVRDLRISGWNIPRLVIGSVQEQMA